MSHDQAQPPISHAKPSVTPVAIIVRTKNRPLFLRRALDDIFSQTFTDFVVIVVNDAGDAAEVDKVVTKFSDVAHGRIQTIHRECSTGMESASNAGLHASTSTYVCIHDDDDTWAPTFLEQTVGHLEGSDDHGVAVRTEVVYEHVEGNEIDVDAREIIAADATRVSLARMLVRNYVPPISLLYRRDVHDSVGFYDETLTVLGDWDFNLRFLSRFSMGFIDGSPLAFWRQRPASVGDEGNSVVTGRQDHERTEMEIRDRYLRSDLHRESGLGTLLFLAESLRRANAERATHLSTAVEHLDNIIHQAAADLDNIIHQAAADRTTQVSAAVQHLEEITRTVGVSQFTRELVELNRNLVSQNNRMIAQFDALNERHNQLEQLVFSQTPRARLLSYQRVARHHLIRLGNRFRRRK